MSRNSKVLALLLAVALHLPLFWQWQTGLRRGELVAAPASQSGVSLKLAARPTPAPAPVAATPRPITPVEARPTPRPQPPQEATPTVVAEPPRDTTAMATSSDRQEEGDEETTDQTGVSGGQVMGLGGASTDGNQDSAMERYLGVVQSRIQRTKEYPSQARLRGEEGTVEVAFAISAAGKIENFRIVRSSGSVLLDRSVERLFARLRLPAPAPELLPQLTDLRLPILFELNNR